MQEIMIEVFHPQRYSYSVHSPSNPRELGDIYRYSLFFGEVFDMVLFTSSTGNCVRFSEALFISSRFCRHCRERAPMIK